MLISVKKTNFRLKKEKKMNKRLSLYQIFMVAMTTIIAAMLVAMGVIALQKTMRLNLSFSIDPNFNVKVEYKLAQEDEYIFAFSNSSLDAKGVSLGNNVELSGDKITLVDGSFTGFGKTIYIKVTNYTKLPTEGNYDFIKLSSGENATGVSVYTEGLEPYEENLGAPYVEFSVIITSESGVVNIPLNFEWIAGYTVTFNLDNWRAIYDSEEVETVKVWPNSDLTVTVGGSGEREGYLIHSSPNITNGTVEETTFDRYTGELTLKNIQSDLKISAIDFKPWTFGKYVSTYNSETEPEIGTIINGSDVYYPAFDGYKYVIFANHETQENNFYISSPGDMAARWIMIGAGESVNSEVFNAVSRPADVDAEIEAEELKDNEVLLLSEYVLTCQSYHSSYTESCGWSGSALRAYLNGDFLINSGLSAYSTYIKSNNYINTWWNDTDDSISNQTVFFLADGIMSSYSTCTTSFIAQTYLGAAHSNSRYNTFQGADDKWWLRSASKFLMGTLGYGYRAAITTTNDTDGVVQAATLTSSSGVRPAFVLNLA